MTTHPEILADFESLGDTCEFGFVQRAAGIEPLGFFRMNFAPLPGLWQALESDFAGMDEPGALTVTLEPHGEYMVRVPRYGFAWHTGKHAGAVAPEKLLAQQVIATRFLLGKLRQDMASATKLFVRKGEDTQSEADAMALLQALRRYGPATLLWVTLQDAEHPAGTVRRVRDGLLQGYIDRFCPPGDIADVSLAWLDICRAAHALRQEPPRHGVAEAARQSRPSVNLIAQSDSFGGPGWQTGDAAASAVSEEVPRLRPEAAVVAHLLEIRTGVGTEALQSRLIEHGLTPGEIYTASIYVWLETDFVGTELGAVLEGVPSLGLRNADLVARNAWQRVSVSARLPDGNRKFNLSLRLRGPAGSRVFSTCWQLERGAQPGPYEPGGTPA